MGTKVIDVQRHYSVHHRHKIEEQIKNTDEAGVTMSLLSFSMGLETFSRFLPSIMMDKWTRNWNNSFAKTVALYPDKLAFMAMINPFLKNSIKECERCFNELGARGICLGSSWRGEFLDSKTLEPFWEYVNLKNEPIFIHPPYKPIGHQQMEGNLYDLWEAIGRPFDTCVSVARLICSGVFDRYPNLQLIMPHMGDGLVTFFIDRLDFRYELGGYHYYCFSAKKPVCKEKPSYYLRKNINVDTMGFSPIGIKNCIEVLGIDRLLFGSDYPFVEVSPKVHIDIIKCLGLSQDDQDKIFWKNAAKLFKLK